MTNKALLEVLSPVRTKESKYYQILKASNIKGSIAYQLDWTYIFKNIDHYIKKYNRNQCVILDVGCGNSMFHLFLEQYYGQGIIGIDRTDSTIQKAELIKMGHTVTNVTDICNLVIYCYKTICILEANKMSEKEMELLIRIEKACALRRCNPCVYPNCQRFVREQRMIRRIILQDAGM